MSDQRVFVASFTRSTFLRFQDSQDFAGRIERMLRLSMGVDLEAMVEPEEEEAEEKEEEEDKDGEEVDAEGDKEDEKTEEESATAEEAVTEGETKPDEKEDEVEVNTRYWLLALQEAGTAKLNIDPSFLWEIRPPSVL